jgi:uncharacterized protein (DUF2252 family)
MTRQQSGVRERIEVFNRGRRPELIERKCAAMRADAFVFFRGTAHLFWEDWRSVASRFDDAPLVWASGDLHLENFGSYRGDNGLAYFDINDFDEGGLAPATRDLARFLTSARLAAQSLGATAPTVTELSGTYLDAYATALADGNARWVERATAQGMVRDLLDGVKSRTRARLLATRTIVKGGKRHLRIDGDRAFALLSQERKSVKECIGAFAASQPHPLFYDVLDVAGRIAGTGSLGVRRYVVLVRGDGPPDGYRLLDVKEAAPSCLVANLSPRLASAQPRWRNDAERVVKIQQRMQAIAPALLTAVSLAHGHSILRELQPREDRLALGEWNGKIGRLRKVMTTMGHLTAWSQLRSASRDGSAPIDALIEFSHERRIRADLISFAREYAERAERDWREFREPS